MYEKEGSEVAKSICTRCLHKVTLVGWDDNTSSWHHDATGQFTCPGAPTVLADMESMVIEPEVKKVLEPWLLVEVADANNLDYLTAMDRHHEEDRQKVVEFHALVKDGMSDHEARATIWPEPPSTGLGTDDTHGDINGGLT